VVTENKTKLRIRVVINCNEIPVSHRVSMASKEIDSSVFFSISCRSSRSYYQQDFPSSLDIALETLIPPPPASNKGV
jgi:hypothetical protein